jgi:hypothetical protein
MAQKIGELTVSLIKTTLSLVSRNWLREPQPPVVDVASLTTDNSQLPTDL